MKIYLVYKNADMTEGRGPMILDSVWLNKENADNYIDQQQGVMGRECKWSEQEYGDWVVKESSTRD